jgi:hypothetical protein
MKSLTFFIFFMLGTVLYGQSDSIEKAIIFQKVLNKEIGTFEYASIGPKWNETIKKLGKYPDLPLDQAGTVHYSYVKDFAGIKKEKLFTHILEWLSINHGIFPEFLYSNPEDGRIVIHNSASILHAFSVNYTSVFSIKNEKVLIEYFNVGYQRYYDGYVAGDSFYIPERTVSFGINQVYPVILKKYADWNSDLLLLKTTNDFIKADADNLSHFILNYDSYSNF